MTEIDQAIEHGGCPGEFAGAHRGQLSFFNMRYKSSSCLGCCGDFRPSTLNAGGTPTLLYEIVCLLE
jgi:hypothetical protein